MSAEVENMNECFSDAEISAAMTFVILFLLLFSVLTICLNGRRIYFTQLALLRFVTSDNCETSTKTNINNLT